MNKKQLSVFTHISVLYTIFIITLIALVCKAKSVSMSDPGSILYSDLTIICNLASYSIVLLRRFSFRPIIEILLCMGAGVGVVAILYWCCTLGIIIVDSDIILKNNINLYGWLILFFPLINVLVILFFFPWISGRLQVFIRHN